MTNQIVMPQLGLTMTEGSVSSWAKQPGERVEKGETLFTVETDKVEMEVESTASGFVQSLLVGVGEIVKTGTPIAVIGDTPQANQLPSGEPFTSPRARRLAKELGVDLKQVEAARGPRICEEDVRRYFEKSGAAAAPVAPAPERPKNTRERIAERLSASFREAPHFYVAAEIDASELVRFRAHTLETVQERTGIRFTFTDLFLMALAKSLAGHPEVNAFWRDGTIVHQSGVHVGFAVQTENSLMVPVIRDADGLKFEEIVRQRRELAERARAGPLTIRDTEGGSVTLSNLGAWGVDWFQAVLNPPQSIIVATGRIAKRPVIIDERVEARDSMTVTVSADHRVVDGVPAAQLLGRLKRFLENPYLLII